MPSKKEEAKTEETPAPVCGHINKHHYNTKGKKEEITCTLPKKHTGDHSAEYTRLVGTQISDEKGRVVRTDYHEEQAVAMWGDGAGVDAAQIYAGEVEQLSLLQKDLVMQVMAKAPNLSAAEALLVAKAQPEWTAAALS